MGRFIDRLLKDDLTWPSHQYDHSDKFVMEQLRKFAKINIAAANNSERIVIDDVASYLLQHNEQETFGVFEDFPNLAPPFADMWLEYKIPDYIYSAECGRTSMEKIGDYTGVLIRTKSQPDGGWYMSATCFMGAHDGRNILVNPITLFGVDKLGKSYGPRNEKNAEFMFFGMKPEARLKLPPACLAIPPLVFPALMAVCFMHCKGSRLSNSSVPPKLAKSYQRKHGMPLAKYKILDVEVVKQLLESTGNSKQVGICKALHICRGHFAHYTAEKPLFGKHVGTYFIPDHLRGSEKLGTVDKTYNVRAPELRNRTADQES